MAHKLSNPQSRQALEHKLRKGLSYLEVTDGFPLGISHELRQFFSEALKSVSEWVTQDDLIRMVVLAYHEHCSTARERGRGMFKDITPAEEVNRAIDEVMSTLAALPKDYTVWFPTPNLAQMSDKTAIALNDQIKLVPSQRHELPGVTSFRFQVAEPVIEIAAIGYGSHNRHQSAARDAISKFKVLAFLCHHTGLFSARPAGAANIMRGFYKETSAPIYSLKFVEADKVTGEAPLTSDFSRYLSNVSIAHDRGSTAFKSAVIEMQELLEILYHSAAQENVRSLRRAIEWSFDARIDEDRTTRFLKTCIGLEAALTEQNEEIGITQQLADRCAFILARTTEARFRTRQEIRQIYQLRSKIVHGAVSGLPPSDSLLAKRATELLAAVLAAEINGVLEWWRHGRRRELSRCVDPA